MSRDLLFDTGALIDIYKGRPRIWPFLAEIENNGLNPFLSLISEAELWQGLREGEKQRHQALLSLFKSLPLRSEIARTAGSWRQQYREQGLGWMDAFIAATAHHAGVPLLSRDQKLAACLASELDFELYG